MTKEKLHRKSAVTPRGGKQADSVAASKARGNARAFDVLMQAQLYWMNMYEFRRDRERNKRYCFGDQWSDVIEVDGCQMTEEQYIRKRGNIPLKNNLIRRLVRNVVGVYRNQAKTPTCIARDRDEQKLGETMSTVLQYNMQLNRTKALNALCMKELLISGFVVQRKSYGWRNDRLDCWSDYVNPNNFFIDNCMRDPRGWDVSCLGEIHDMGFQELCQQYADTPADYSRLAQIYNYSHDREYMSSYISTFGYSREDTTLDFMFTDDPTRCRVIEVWRKETKPRFRCHDWNSGEIYKINAEDYAAEVEVVNNRRLAQAAAVGMPEEDVPLIEATWFIDSYWYYYCLSPFGDILKEGETPYEHKSHPYVFKAYPFIDGETHSFVGDVIDQQRYTNHLIMLHDFMLKSSAKGVLLFPEEAKPDDMSMDDIADEWTRIDGLIVYKAKPGVAAPQQIASNLTNIGITDLLNLQLKLFEDISGVNGALQGKPGYSQMSGTLYAQQTQNATTSLLDLLETFDDFVIEGAIKDVKNMQQYYDEKKVFNIAGNRAVAYYDPTRLRDVEFDLSVAESTDTAVYRQASNDMLMQLFQAQAISVEQLLENGSFPFADTLLQSIRSQKEQVQNGEIPEGISPALRQQVAAQSDPQNIQRAQQMLGA